MITSVYFHSAKFEVGNFNRVLRNSFYFWFEWTVSLIVLNNCEFMEIMRWTVYKEVNMKAVFTIMNIT